jgi:hypothetical protein
LFKPNDAIVIVRCSLFVGMIIFIYKKMVNSERECCSGNGRKKNQKKKKIASIESVEEKIDGTEGIRLAITRRYP